MREIQQEERILMTKILKVLTVIAAISFVVGAAVFCFTYGQKSMSVSEFKETAEKMPEKRY